MGEFIMGLVLVAFFTWAICWWVARDNKRLDHEWRTRTGRYANWHKGRHYMRRGL